MNILIKQFLARTCPFCTTRGSSTTKKILLILVSFALVNVAGLAGELFRQCLFDFRCGGKEWVRFGVSVPMYVAFAFFALALGRQLITVNVLSRSKKSRAKQAVIAFVSTGGRITRHSDGQWRLTYHDKECVLTCELENDIRALDQCKPPFQQLLRALRPHWQVVRHIVLLHTKDSLSMANGCRSILPEYRPGVAVDLVEADFEDFEALMDILGAQVRRLGRLGFHDHDIILDVTGGQKTASIAAAMITLQSRDLEFQYVSTTPPNDVLQYNATGEREQMGSS